MWGVLCAPASTVGLRLLHPDWLPRPTGRHWRGERRTVLQCILSRSMDQYAAGSVSWRRRVRRRWVYSVWVIYVQEHSLYRIRFNFRGVKLSRFSRISSHLQKFHPVKFGPVWQRVCSCKTIVSQKCKKWWRFPRATWHAAKNLHWSNWLHQYDVQRKWWIDESKTKTLHPQKYIHESCSNLRAAKV